MTNDRLRFLFNRYVNQTISEDEKKEFFNLIAAAETDDNLKRLLDELWASIPEENVHVEISEKIYESVIGHSSAERRITTGRKKRWLRIAAAISFVALASFAVHLYSTSGSQTDRVAISGIEKNNQHDAFIRLPDGSTVVLNERSTLKYPETFVGNATREVYLEGEGYFDIIHDPSKPFIVHSGTISTRVLGTSFNIKAFPDAENVVVTVTRGKVQVSSNEKVIGVINRDQQISVDKKSVKINQQAVNSQESIAWMERDIFFDDVTLEDAAVELENRFDVKIKFLNDQIKDCRFTATFVKGEDLDQILVVICEFNKANFQRKDSGNLIEIDGVGCE